MLEDQEVVLVLVTLMVFAGIGVLFMAMSNRRALREMEHRERLAMIQRGLIPSPEADPLGFEAATLGPLEASASVRSERWRSAGIMIIGLGLALMMLLSFTAGEPGVGIGIGGAFAVLGATLLLNGTHIGRSDIPRRRPTPSPRQYPYPPEPPPNVSPPPPTRPEL
jgi:hypothetical protein